MPIKKGWFSKGDFKVWITVPGDWPKRWTNALERDRRESKYYWKKTIGYMSPCLSHYDQICQKMSRNYILKIWSRLGWRKFLETVKSSLNSFEWLQATDFCTIKKKLYEFKNISPFCAASFPMEEYTLYKWWNHVLNT